MTVHALEAIVLGSVLVVAAWTDIRYRRVPNVWLGLGLVAYVILFWLFGFDPWKAVLGGLLGLIVFLPFYWLGGMGAADLKLLGLVGVYLGPQGVLYSALYTALAGGALAVLALVLRASRRLPYAVAIAVGVGVYEFRSFLSF
ncbi:A24 family peptidase [Ferrovum myxofaciens]|jgi:prepilin peptidase CpaA|uniref:Type IV leader peptidase family protein n=1 Tax=Ferrovum myxofaciens TaxID=416213 RepID=A0A149VY26_9PROT|nr:prepilin peptidase [Ferrovum myxofaciens]KXW57814.1 type IV leader peptidase family protein [Ferrovum myxofaciens]